MRRGKWLGLGEAVRQGVRQGGLRVVFSGMEAALLRQAIYGTLKITLYETFKARFGPGHTTKGSKVAHRTRHAPRATRHAPHARAHRTGRTRPVGLTCCLSGAAIDGRIGPLWRGGGRALGGGGQPDRPHQGAHAGRGHDAGATRLSVAALGRDHHHSQGGPHGPLQGLDTNCATVRLPTTTLAPRLSQC